MTKDCTKILSLLAEHYYGELDPDRGAMVADHLTTCDACRKEFQALQGLLDSVPRDLEVQLPPALSDRIRRKVRSGIRELPESGPWFRRFRWMPALASVAVVLFLGMLTFRVLPVGKGEETAVSQEELEVAENMDLLENMELLELLDVMEEILLAPDPNGKEGNRL